MDKVDNKCESHTADNFSNEKCLIHQDILMCSQNKTWIPSLLYDSIVRFLYIKK